MANTTSDKTQAMINFLLECPQIQDSPLYFNFINADDDSTQFITSANDVAGRRTYIDGSVMKTYTFNIIRFVSIARRAIVQTGEETDTMYGDENIEEFMDTQNFVDWLTTKNEAKEYPDFGDCCVIEEMRALTESFTLDSIDMETNPPLAQYSLSIEVRYLDTSKVIWNKTN